VLSATSVSCGIASKQSRSCDFIFIRLGNNVEPYSDTGKDVRRFEASTHLRGSPESPASHRKAR
jgi:hypothetical protein